MKCLLFLLIPVFVLFSSVTHATPPAELPVTGQTSCYDTAGTAISCPGTGQDGEIRAGVTWPVPRFTDNGNGTVTDNLTGLIWLKEANCTATVGGISKTNTLNWENALTWSSSLSSGYCGLMDGSAAGQWRLPNINELESLVDEQRFRPALLSGHPFSGVQASYYWSSSSCADSTSVAWIVGMDVGYVYDINKTASNYVWPVRAGQ